MSGVSQIPINEKGIYEVQASKDGNVSQIERVEFTTNGQRIEITLIIDYTDSHNATYRGEQLFDHEMGVGNFLSIENLYNSVKAGYFKDIYVGDYVTYNGMNYIIMGIDTYKGKGVVENDAHHLVIVPEHIMGREAMNDSDDSSTGYTNSVMHKTTLQSSYYLGILNTVLENHILNGTWTLSTNDSEGTAKQICKIRLLNGTAVFGKEEYGNQYDVGEMDTILPGFSLNTNLRIKQNDGWWLSSVFRLYQGAFLYVQSDGTVDFLSADVSRGVVPMVLFG